MITVTLLHTCRNVQKLLFRVSVSLTAEDHVTCGRRQRLHDDLAVSHHISWPNLH